MPPKIVRFTALALMAAACTAHAATIVHWGNSPDIVPTGQFSQNMSVGKNDITLDLGTLSNPAIGTNYYSDSTGATPEFFAVSQGLADGTPLGNFTWRVDPSDELLVSLNIGTEATQGTARALYVWTKDYFLAGGDTASSVALTGMDFDGDVNSGFVDSRFAIRLGTQFYVSDSANADLRSFTDPTALTWYNYDPLTDFADFTGTAAALDLAAFEDLTAVGIFVEKTINGQYTTLSMEAFTVTATVIPQPGVASLALCGGLLSLLHRRRKS